jgi:2-methylcitrate dehydratase PrpD
VWETRNVGYKPYAAVTSIHTALDGLAQLMRDNGLKADDIASVDAGLSQATYVHCAWEYKAQGVTAAQMNLYYGMAMIALDGTAFVDQYREERLRDPRVLDLVPRIRAHIDPEIEAMGAAFRHGSRVSVATRDGRSFRTEILNRRGSAENPLQPEDIEYKFRQVVKSCLDAGRAERMLGIVRGIETLADIGELIALMAAPAR